MTSPTLCRADLLLAGARSAGPVLGLDTGTSIASIALAVDGRIVGEISRPVTSHGAALPGAVEELLNKAGLRPSDLSGVAVGIGPGSFTGLRIGLSYAKGLVMASKAKIVGVPSLDAIAIAALDSPAARPGLMVCPLVDARKGEVYTALYEIMGDGLEKVSWDVVMPLVRVISHLSQGAILAGDNQANDAAALLKDRGLDVTVLEQSALEARGRNVAALGAARIASGDSDPAGTLEPLYVRSPEATIKAAGNATGTEGVWSVEKRNSSVSIWMRTTN
ncbi:MAG: tRNA (adenosine(37)-N6)-threonylcarbamoyltransferase complex dimerization subunit type 1 TsaB [Candidatus Binataceae bacterium]